MGFDLVEIYSIPKSSFNIRISDRALLDVPIKFNLKLI